MVIMTITISLVIMTISISHGDHDYLTGDNHVVVLTLEKKQPGKT